MGGRIRIIKKQDNQFESYESWTNNIPVITFTSKFYKDEEWASSAIKELGTKDKKSNFDSSEYGVILIDFDSKRIYDCQGYCSIGDCHISSIDLAQSPNVNGYEYVLTGLKEFCEDEAMIHNIITYDKGYTKIGLTSKKITYNEAVKLSKPSNRFKKSIFSKNLTRDTLNVDVSKYGWSINSYMDNTFDFFSKLIEDGYNVINMTNFETWDNDEEDEVGLRSRLLSIVRNNKLNTIIE